MSTSTALSAALSSTAALPEAVFDWNSRLTIVSLDDGHNVEVLLKAEPDLIYQEQGIFGYVNWQTMDNIEAAA